jgi:uncharacterized ubiquitin-like protein YukD
MVANILKIRDIRNTVLRSEYHPKNSPYCIRILFNSVDIDSVRAVLKAMGAKELAYNVWNADEVTAYGFQGYVIAIKSANPKLLPTEDYLYDYQLTFVKEQI